MVSLKIRRCKFQLVPQDDITFYIMLSVRTHLQPQYASCMTVVAIKQRSLNNCLLTGQPQLNYLCCIILRFRLHPVRICTDIKTAFLHIQLHEDDRDYTKFLWLSDPKDPDSEFVTYRFRVVLFGVVCSPFMLNAALHCHLAQYNSPTAQSMLANLYVDNVVSGCPSEY